MLEITAHHCATLRSPLHSLTPHFRGALWSMWGISRKSWLFCYRSLTLFEMGLNVTMDVHIISFLKGHYYFSLLSLSLWHPKTESGIHLFCYRLMIWHLNSFQVSKIVDWSCCVGTVYHIIKNQFVILVTGQNMKIINQIISYWHQKGDI